jgi:hypothetical protein
MTGTLRLRRGALRSMGLAALGLGVAACGSAAAVAGSASPTPSASGRGLRANATAGTLVQVSGDTLVLASPSGIDTTVTFSSSTPITETSTGSYQDIAVGTCIAGTGTKDATGAVTLSTISVSPELNGSCSARALLGGSPGAFPSSRPSFTFRARATPSGLPANFATVRGAVTAVVGTAVTVVTPQGTSQTLTVPTTVRVTMTSVGSASDLTQGVCVLALGPKGSSGTVAARALSIVPPGPSGCFTGAGGLGAAFGGFGGGGGGRSFFGGG